MVANWLSRVNNLMVNKKTKKAVSVSEGNDCFSNRSHVPVELDWNGGKDALDISKVGSYNSTIPTPLGGGIKPEDIMKHEDAAKRLKTVEGHVAGIRRMLEEDAYCIDVIRQIQAVQAALNKVGKIVLDEHLHSCVITAVQGEDQSERERVLQEIIDVYETSNKV
jgi:DNA-binding FrmR family transcriptional regulator